METSFFKYSDVYHRQLTYEFRKEKFVYSSEFLIQILQNISIKKEAHNLDDYFNKILEKAHNTLPTSMLKYLKSIITPLQQKLLISIRLLISLETAARIEHVEWAKLDASLLEIETEVKSLFHHWRLTIKGMKFLLIPLFQNFLEDIRTKQAIVECFDDQSFKPLLYQMIYNEVTECENTPPLPAAELSIFSIYNSMLLDTALENVIDSECGPGTEFYDKNQKIIRDLAYLQMIGANDFYYRDVNDNSVKTCRLPQLRRMDLLQLIQQLLLSTHWHNEDHAQRHQLQLLAVLNALYYKLNQMSLNIEELAAILLALNQARIEFQWQLRVNQTSSRASLFLVCLLCLRGNVIHIEQAQRLLELDNRSQTAYIFLENLGIMYEPYLSNCSAKMGLLHMKNLNKSGKTYYFGSQIIFFGIDARLDNYFTQTLLEMKQKILQAYDSWYALLWTILISAELRPSDPIWLNPLRGYRESLVKKVEQTWINHVVQEAPYQSLSQIDQMIESFYQNNLAEIWQETAQSLLAWTRLNQVFSASQGPINALPKLLSPVEKCPARYALTLSELKFTLDSVLRQQLISRLYYDRNDWPDEEKAKWIQLYLKRQILLLHRLCPGIDKKSSELEQLRFFVNHFVQLPSDKLSIECIAASLICLNLYHNLAEILPWSNDTGVEQTIETLSALSGDTMFQLLAEKVMAELRWATETNSFYYQWLESNNVKHAAFSVYTSAQSLLANPSDPKKIKDFLTAVTEQQQILAQRTWYIHWGWLWSYQDTGEVLNMTYQQILKMMTHQLLPGRIMHEVKEELGCKKLLQDFNVLIDRFVPGSEQSDSYSQVLQHIQFLKRTYSGVILVYELRAYLETQRQKFTQTEYGFFYGPLRRDPVVAWIALLNQGLSMIVQNPDSILSNHQYLIEKIKQSRAQQQEGTEAYIHPGYGEEPCIDVWINAKANHSIEAFHKDNRSPNTWYKRFYHMDDFCAYTRDLYEEQSCIAP